LSIGGFSCNSGPSGSESSLASQHYNPSLVDTDIVSMHSLADTTPILGGDASLDHDVSHHVQLAVLPIQYSANTTLVFRSDASLDHVFSHPIQPTIE
jgi:hypothetical protein